MALDRILHGGQAPRTVAEVLAERQQRATADGQKRLMAESMGLPSDTYLRKLVEMSRPGDYGADPIGDGMFRMIPSGDVVDYAERCLRLDR